MDRAKRIHMVAMNNSFFFLLIVVVGLGVLCEDWPQVRFNPTSSKVIPCMLIPRNHGVAAKNYAQGSGISADPEDVGCASCHSFTGILRVYRHF